MTPKITKSKYFGRLKGYVIWKDTIIEIQKKACMGMRWCKKILNGKTREKLLTIYGSFFRFLYHFAPLSVMDRNYWKFIVLYKRTSRTQIILE